MNEKKLKETAARHAPAAQKGRHIVTAFVSGGLIGAFGQLLLVVYQQLLHLDQDQGAGDDVGERDAHRGAHERTGQI